MSGGIRPKPDVPVPNLPALKPTLDPDGDVSPANFDKHGCICQHDVNIETAASFRNHMSEPLPAL
jgi:hypothetical protein